MTKTQSKPYWSLSAVIVVFILLTKVPLIFLTVYFATNEIESRLVARFETELFDAMSLVSQQIDKKLAQTQQSLKRMQSYLDRRLVSPTQQHIDEFNKITRIDPDGAYRNIKENFKPEYESAIWIRANEEVTDFDRSILIQSKKLFEVYGAGAQGHYFDDSWILMHNNGMSMFWPEGPEWTYNNSADLDFAGSPWLQLADPATNPRGEIKWTPAIYDPGVNVWMISAVAPLYFEDKWIASIGHDVIISNIADDLKPLEAFSEVAYYLVSADGTVLASNTLNEKIIESNGTLNIKNTQMDTLKTVWQRDMNKDSFAYDDPELGFYSIVKKLPATNWRLIVLAPRQPMIDLVRESFSTLYWWGLAAIVLLIVISFAFFSTLLYRLVNNLNGTASEVVEGHDARFNLSNISEFKAIEGSLNTMVETITEHKIELEETVKQRTSELVERTDQLHKTQDELLRKERLAALGQLTASVSHELRNPLGTLRNSLFSINERITGKELGVENALTRMERNITRCDNIISEMLDYTRIHELILSTTAIDSWLKELLDEHPIPEDITVIQTLDADITLPIDKERMRRAIINVLDNASQALEELSDSENREIHMGLSVLSHNLWVLARLKLAQQARLKQAA